MNNLQLHTIDCANDPHLELFLDYILQESQAELSKMNFAFVANYTYNNPTSLFRGEAFVTKSKFDYFDDHPLMHCNRIKKVSSILELAFM